MQILKVKTKNRIKGDIGEEAACRFLKKRGYKILERNYIEAGHEIDIIAQNHEYIVFVEVKTRSYSENSYEDRPAAAVTPKKQRSIISAAGIYAAANKGERKLRLDVIEVYLDNDGTVKGIEHIEGAFNRNTAFSKNYR